MRWTKDIAWFIYANRLSLAGYPLVRLHPRLGAWAEKLAMRPEFAKEIAMPPEAVARIEATRLVQTRAGKTLEAVAGF
jgi:glutathione S-transferase